MTSKFDYVATTLNALTNEKKPKCVEALTREFYVGVETGLSNRQAYYYAGITHLMNDHDGANSVKSIQVSDEEIRQNIVDTLMSKNDDGRAEERIDIVIEWYDLVLSWDVPIALAFSIAARAGQEEWEEANDMDEAEALGHLNSIPTENEEDEDFKSATISRFHALRKEGETVTAALRITVAEAEETLELRVFAKILSSAGNRGLLN